MDQALSAKLIKDYIMGGFVSTQSSNGIQHVCFRYSTIPINATQ